MKVKGKGFLRNRGTDLFSGRVVPPGTVFTSENFADLSYIAENFGNGKLICTSRQAVEIPGIPFEKIDEVIAYAEAHSLSFGGTGNKVRPVTACKGTTCVYGNFDNYIAMHSAKRGSKFKYLLSRIFLSYAELTDVYPSLKGKRILTPIYQIRRFANLIFKKGSAKRSISELKRTAAIDKSKSSKTQEFMKSLELI